MKNKKAMIAILAAASATAVAAPLIINAVTQSPTVVYGPPVDMEHEYIPERDVPVAVYGPKPDFVDEYDSASDNEALEHEDVNMSNENGEIKLNDAGNTKNSGNIEPELNYSPEIDREVVVYGPEPDFDDED